MVTVMIDRHQPRASAPSPIDMVDAVRSTVSRWIGRDDGEAKHRSMCEEQYPHRPMATGASYAHGWTSLPRERTLPSNLDMPLSLFDPGAIRDWSPPRRAAGMPDPVMLERTLHRLSAMMGR